MPSLPRKAPYPFDKPLVVFGVKRPPSSVTTSSQPSVPDTAPVDDAKAKDTVSPGTEGIMS